MNAILNNVDQVKADLKSDKATRRKASLTDHRHVHCPSWMHTGLQDCWQLGSVHARQDIGAQCCRRGLSCSTHSWTAQTTCGRSTSRQSGSAPRTLCQVRRGHATFVPHQRQRPLRLEAAAVHGPKAAAGGPRPACCMLHACCTLRPSSQTPVQVVCLCSRLVAGAVLGAGGVCG
jgi:hypothetical protein